MYLLGLLIGSSTALGIGYFCMDLYCNRRRLSTKPNPSAKWLCFDTIPSPDGGNVQATGQVANHVSHAVGEASHCASHGVEHCIEAIAHTLSHY